MEKLDDRISMILREQHIKQSEFASALGVSPNYVSLLVNGKKTNISLTLAKLIEVVYGYSASWVMSGKGTKASTAMLRSHLIKRIEDMDDDALIKLFSAIAEK